jgi:hypothetical protein
MEYVRGSSGVISQEVDEILGWFHKGCSLLDWKEVHLILVLRPSFYTPDDIW